MNISFLPSSFKNTALQMTDSQLLLKLWGLIVFLTYLYLYIGRDSHGGWGITEWQYPKFINNYSIDFHVIVWDCLTKCGYIIRLITNFISQLNFPKCLFFLRYYHIVFYYIINFDVIAALLIRFITRQYFMCWEKS